MHHWLVVVIGLGWGVGVAGMVSTGIQRRESRRAGDPSPRRPRTPFGRVALDARNRQRRRRHDAAMRRAVPVGFDLAIIATSAGASIHAAIAVASQWAPHPLRTRLREVEAGTRLGLGLADALTRVAESDAAFARFADAIVLADRSGAPVADQLRAAAYDLRRDHRQAAERRARRTSVQLLFPLVLLVFPAFVLLALAPLAISGISGL